MKIKARAKNGVVKVKMLISHVMETGRRKDQDGQLIPGHYVTEVSASHKGQQIFHVETGPAVSKDPYIAFVFKGGASGDTVSITWIDNLGKSETAEAVIK